MRRAGLFLRDERGAASVVIAMCGGALLGFAAVAVDLGSIFLQSRQLQGMADLAAMAAARDIPNAQAAAEATARANGWSGALRVTVTPGSYSANPGASAATRFSAGNAPANAVQVTLHSEAHLFFGRAILGRDTTPISRSATAARAEFAAFSLGSRLASLNGGIANGLLTALTGSSVNLSVMDYEALLAADVSLLDYVDALRTHLSLEGASYDRVLKSEMTTGAALSVLGGLLNDHGEDRAATAVNTLAVAAGATTRVTLSELLNLGPYGPQDKAMGGSGAGIAVSALDLATATLQLANGGRQLALDLGAGVHGLADVDVWLAIGERPNNSPWLTVAKDNSVVLRTTQTRLYVEAKVGAGGLLGSVAQIKVPLAADVAAAEARLSSMDCAGGSAVLDVRPSIGELSVGEIDRSKLNDFKTALDVQQANLVSTLLLKVQGKANVKLGGAGWQQVGFSAAEISSGAIKTVKTNDVAAATTSSLLGNLSLDVSILGLGLGLGKSGILSAVGQILGAAAQPLDGVLNALLDLLGVGLGEADVKVSGLRCKDSALVG
jgi:uncharacterized membrane protein